MTDMQEEIWAAIQLPEILPIYAASNRGRIKNVTTGKILSSTDNGNGYLIVSLRASGGGSKTKTVHRLVADCFLKYTGTGRAVANHKDGNKKNNYLENLELCSYSDNLKHAHMTGLKRMPRKLSDSHVFEIRGMIGTASHSNIASRFGVARTTVRDIANGKTWKDL
ncbi:MAG: NUMOD4 domain-containing protein [Sulfuricellaceae bacterium]